MSSGGRAARRRSRPGDRGSVVLPVVALGGVLLLVGLVAAFVVATAVAHRAAQSAADLAALAGAGVHQRGEDGCAAAGRVAAANQARLVTCELRGAAVVVRVEVTGPRFLGHGWTPHGMARAGPVSGPGPPTASGG